MSSHRELIRVGDVPLSPWMLERIGLTDHAILRFAHRAGLVTSRRPIIEPLLRDLLLREGRVVARRPHWAGSHNTADLYLQLGDWMLLIGCHDERRRGYYAIVTAIDRPDHSTWRSAVRRGYIQTRPPAEVSSQWHYFICRLRMRATRR